MSTIQTIRTVECVRIVEIQRAVDEVYVSRSAIQARERIRDLSVDMFDEGYRTLQVGTENDIQTVVDRSADWFEEQDLAEIGILSREGQSVYAAGSGGR